MYSIENLIVNSFYVFILLCWNVSVIIGFMLNLSNINCLHGCQNYKAYIIKLNVKFDISPFSSVSTWIWRSITVFAGFRVC